MIGFPDSMTLIRSFKFGKSNTESDKTFTICNSTDFSDFLTQLHSQSSGQIGNVTLPGSMGNSLTSLGDGVGWPHVHSRNVYIYIYIYQS